MLVFGHSGIALGSALVLAGAFTGSRFLKATKSEAVASSFPAPAASSSSCEASWLDSLATRVDIRLLLIGSLLPDIIDKPIGQFFFRETFNNGRIFSHTLLFLILITVAGLYFSRRQSQTWRLSLAFGTLTHLIFDQMWRIPQTLFWPGFGFAFPKANISNWIPKILNALFSNPEVYVPELVGVAILIWFAETLRRRRKISVFLRYGRIQ